MTVESVRFYWFPHGLDNFLELLSLFFDEFLELQGWWPPAPSPFLLSNMRKSLMVSSCSAIFAFNSSYLPGQGAYSSRGTIPKRFKYSLNDSRNSSSDFFHMAEIIRAVSAISSKP